MKKFIKKLFYKRKGNTKKYKLLGLTLVSITKKANKKIIKILGVKFTKKDTSALVNTDVSEIKFTKFQLIDKIKESLDFPEIKSPKVSIIIPVYNQYHYTNLCLQSILENTKDVSFEVIIADDNSTDETKSIEKHVSNIIISRNEKNLGFLRNCNKAVQKARGKYIVFLNNDTQVQEKWLSALVETIENDITVGLVGSKLIYPNGKLQEAGGIVYSNAEACNYGNGDNPDLLQYNYKKEVDYISGASIMLRKKTFDEVGGFSETFVPAYYEDTDLAFKIRYNKGLKVIYVPKSIVVHYEGISCGTDVSAGTKHYQIENRNKFYDKWKKELRADYSVPTCNNFLSRDHAVNRKCILVIDWKILSFTKDTGSRTTYQYMHFFKDMGFDVKFYPHDWFLEDNYLQQFLDDGFEVIHKDFSEYIANFGCNFDYVYLNRPNIAPFYIDLLRRYTKAKIIYQCHDLHYLRQYRNRMLTDVEKAYKLLLTEKKSEFDVFSKMDVVCSFSCDEVNIIKKEDATINAVQIPLYILDAEKMVRYNYSASARKDIMFVAGFQHAPNVDAAVWFVTSIWPEVKRKYPDIRLYLVGSNPTEQVQKLQSEDVIVTGFVTDDKLEDYYSKIKLVVVPLRSGAGVKGKIIEAIYHKVPVITTSIGIEGIDNTDELIREKNTDSDWIEEVVGLYSADNTLDLISKKSSKFIHDNFSKKAVVEALSGYMQFH